MSEDRRGPPEQQDEFARFGLSMLLTEARKPERDLWLVRIAALTGMGLAVALLVAAIHAEIGVAFCALLAFGPALALSSSREGARWPSPRWLAAWPSSLRAIWRATVRTFRSPSASSRHSSYVLCPGEWSAVAEVDPYDGSLKRTGRRTTSRRFGRSSPVNGDGDINSQEVPTECQDSK